MTLDTVQAKAIFTAKGLTGAELEQAVATATLSASQKKATVSTATLGTAIKGLGVKIKSLAAAHPILLAITAAAAAIGVTYKIWDALTVSLEEAKEQLEETASEFKDAKSEVESVNNELKTTQSRIEELSSKEKLTFVEKSELERLQAVTRELQLQNDALTKKQELKATELGESAIQAYNKEFGDFSDIKEWASTDNLVGLSSLNDPAQMVASLAKLNDELAQELTSGNTEMQAALSMTIETLSGNLLDKLTTLSDYKQNLLSIMDYRELNQAEQAMFDSITEWQREIYSVVDPNKWNQIAFDDIFNTPGIEKTKEELVSLIESGDFDETIADCKVLTEALSNAGFIIDEDTTATQLFKSELKALAQEGETLSSVTENVNFSNILSSLPTDKLEEYIALVKDGIIDEKTIGDYEELSEAISETGVSAEDALKAIKEYSESFVSSAELTQGIQESYNLLTKIQTEVDKTKQISLDSLNSIANQFPELTTATAEYAQGLIATADMMDLLEQAYDDDADAFRSAMVAKLGGNEAFFSTIKENNQGLFTDLANAYGLDVDNWKTMAQAKAAIDQALIKDLSSAWSKYYKIVFDSVTGLASLDGGPDLSRVSSRGTTANPEIQRAWSAANNQKNKINQIMHAFDKAAEIEIETPDFDGIGGKSGSKDSKGSKSKDQSEFDWMEQKITIIDSRVDKLKTNIESLVGYKNKNSMTDTAIDSLVEKMDVLQQMHDKYMEKAGNLGLGQKYIDKIQNGTIEIESVGDENLAKIIKEYQDLFEKAQNTNERIDDTQKAIKELNHSKLDNVINQFSQLTDIQSQLIDTEKQLLGLREKSGEYIFADDYISLSNKQLDLIKQNADAYNVLESEMSKMNLVKGTDEWKKYNDQLQEYKNNMISAADAVEQYKDAMTDLTYKGLNDFKSAMDSINGTISTMNDLIGDTNLVDDFGNLTERGLAQVALYAHQMSNSKQEAAEYAEAIKSLDDALDSGLITQDEYNSMLQDYTSSQESAIKSSKDARDAILSLVKDGIQAEINAKKKLIDETKAVLDAEKDLYDYQKSIKEKQDNISRLQRAIASITSTDRESLRKKLELQNELSKALEELNELQYDHEIEQRKKALDEEYNSFEESKQKESEELDSNLDAQDKAINKYLDQVKNNYSSVYDVLKQYGDEYSLSAIENLTSPWESGTDAAGLCASAIGDAIANIQYEINGLDFSSLYDLAELMSQIGLGEYGGGLSSAFEDISGTGSWQQGQGGKWWYGSSNDDYASGGIYTINGKQYGFDDSGYMTTGWDDSHGDWRYFEPANGEMVKSEWRKDSKGDWYYLDKDGVMATDMAVKAKDGDGYYYLDSKGKWDNQKLDAEQVRKLGYRVGYKKGTRSATKGLHLMDEDGIGSEGILTNKGRLVQFNGGEIVFNPKEMQNLYDIAQDPARLITGLSGIQSNMIDYSKIQPINREQKIEVNMNIGGVLDETTYRLMEQNMPDLLKRNMKQIAGGVSKDIQQELLGKSRR